MALPRVLIIGEQSEAIGKLKTGLAEKGFDCVVISREDIAIKEITRQSAEVLLFDASEQAIGSRRWELAEKARQERGTPVIALLSREKLNGLGSSTAIDDFVLKPWDAVEVIARIRRVLKQREKLDSEQIVNCGDLVIDPSKYEVTLCGKPVALTFKEYQLLRFLASNKGKVFTREVLLDKVWGWDYYGGDRTVDVHIRRLRSKIEDKDHYFIETVRGIGYRFRDR